MYYIKKKKDNHKRRLNMTKIPLQPFPITSCLTKGHVPELTYLRCDALPKLCPMSSECLVWKVYY